MRAGDHQHRAIGRDSHFLKQRERIDLVVFVLEFLLQLRIAAAVARVQVSLAVPLNEIDRLLPLQQPHERAGHALFVGGLRLEMAVAGSHDHRAVAAHFHLAGQLGIAHRIDITDGHARRLRVVIVQQVARGLSAALPLEVVNRHVLVEALQDFDRLGREREFLVGGQVPLLVVIAFHEHVDDHNDGDDHSRVNSEVGARQRLPSAAARYLFFPCHGYALPFRASTDRAVRNKPSAMAER